MTESFSQKSSLVGQVIEDFSYEPLDYQRFAAQLEGENKSPHYKTQGYFAFIDLLPGNYTLVVFGERFQTQRFPVTIPLAPVVFDQPGDNELMIVVKNVNTQNKRITFDADTIRKPIKSGAAVVAIGLSTKLTTTLDAGKVASARLESVTGINPDSIVRIIRDRSIRLRFDPYYQAPAECTRIVGKVTLLDQAEFALQNARISMTKVNGAAVTVSDVGGAKVASVVIGGSKVVLGSERDLQTFANGKGDYNLYFSRDVISSVTLQATLAGFQTATKTVAVTPRTRIRGDFQLAKT